MRPNEPEERRPSCAYYDPIKLRPCIYFAAEGERYCIRHSVLEKVADREERDARAA